MRGWAPPATATARPTRRQQGVSAHGRVQASAACTPACACLCGHLTSSCGVSGGVSLYSGAAAGAEALGPKPWPAAALLAAFFGLLLLLPLPFLPVLLPPPRFLLPLLLLPPPLPPLLLGPVDQGLLPPCLAAQTAVQAAVR